MEASIFARRLNYLELARVYEVGQEREREGGREKTGASQWSNILKH